MAADWRTALDPALRGHARRAVVALRRAEAELRVAVAAAMDAFLDRARTDMLGPRYRVPASLVAAADDASATPPPPDINAFPPPEVWTALVDAHISPVTGQVFGMAFDAHARTATLSSKRAQLSYMENTTDRLSRNLWPDGVFEEIRYEMLLGLSEGDDLNMLRDRIGMTTHIDAYSRRVRAEINHDRRVRDDPHADPEERRAARARLPARYRELDEADSQWHYQARRVARTEAIAAMNGGSYAGVAARAQATGDEMFKQWLATEDARTRLEHAAADGQQRPLHTPFLVGGYPMQFPGEAGAPAHLVCNCRCVVLYLQKSEVTDTTVI